MPILLIETVMTEATPPTQPSPKGTPGNVAIRRRRARVASSPYRNFYGRAVERLRDSERLASMFASADSLGLGSASLSHAFPFLEGQDRSRPFHLAEK
jgi:hypothetical protein